MGKVFTKPPKSLTQAGNPNLVISRDLSLLHPTFRSSAVETIRQLNEEGIPFSLFEAFRSPSRQSRLYAQGRTRPGAIVTRATPWHSYHQYGLAGDFVLRVNGEWTWGGPGVEAIWWERLHEVGEHYGLEFLSFEQPHLQLSGLQLPDLLSGKLPGGGDESWWANVEYWRTQAPIQSPQTQSP